MSVKVEKQEDPLSEPLQVVGIKKVDVERAEKAFRAQNPKEKALSVSKLIDFIIARYNEKKGEHNFDPLPLPVGTWVPKDHNGFALRAYQCVVPIFSSVMKMFEKMEIETAKSTEVSFLFVLSRTHKKAMEIFGLSTGKRGYLPLQPFTDYTFPKAVAIRLLDPENRSKERTKQVTGPVLSQEVILRSNVYFDPSLIHKIYQGFTSALRRDASLLQIPEFRNKDGSVPANPTEIEMKKGILRIHKQLPLKVFSQILDLFSTIARGGRTFLYPPKPKKEEKGSREAFAFLEYFTAVPKETYFFLEDYLLEQVAECVGGKRQLDLDLCHPYTDDYYRATQFRIRYGDKIIESSGSRMTFAQLVAHLRKIQKLKLATKGLKRELRKVTLGMMRQGKWTDEPLLRCLVGELRHSTERGHRTYFKLNRSWYQVSQTLLDRVAQEFKRLMEESLLPYDHEGALQHPWQPKGLNLTVKNAAKELGVTETKVQELCDEEVQYVTEQGAVKFASLQGAILTHPLVFHYKSQIEALLNGHWTIEERQLIDIAGPTLGPKLWNELTTSRKVGEVVEVRKNGKNVPIVRIQNPLLVEEEGRSAEQVEAVETWATLPLYTMDEGDYNEGYLYSVVNKAGRYKPFDFKQGGWLLGDRICPEGIELFDILQVTEDVVYVYHVKEGFGQKTRDACSQILNSARMFHEKEAILETFYKMASTLPKKGDDHSEYRKKVALQMKALGKKGFLNLFKEKKVVFVYAFVDERRNDHVIDPHKSTFTADDFSSKKTAKVAKKLFSDLVQSAYLTPQGEKGKRFDELHNVEALQFQDSQFERYSRFVWEVLSGDIAFFGSLIGRMDLLHTRAQVTGMDYGFNVCQIRRPFSIPSDDMMPGLVSFKGDIEEVEAFEDEVHEEVLFYHTPWSDTAECYVALPTLGDGSCGIHSVLGEEKDGVIQCENPIEIREELVGFLRDDLNDEGSGFKYEGNQNLYLANLTSLIDEASKPDDPESLARRSAKLVFEGVAAFQTYSETDYYKEKLAWEKEILNEAPPSGDVMKTLKKKTSSSKTLKDFKISLEMSDEDFHTLFISCIEDLEAMKISKSHKWMAPSLEEITTLTQQEEEAKEALLESAEVMEQFLDCLSSPDYWLTTDEVQLLGDNWDLRVEIICKDTIGGDYGCTNQHTLPPREADNRELVVVYADGHHYSRCVPFGQ